MIRLYTAQTPNGRKVSIALEELGLAYETQWVHLDREEQLTPEFLALNPNHKIPVLVDDGQAIWESCAILLHLGERHDPEGRILARAATDRDEVLVADLDPALVEQSTARRLFLKHRRTDWMSGPAG